MHESAHINIVQKGIKKIKILNLRAVRHRKNKRLAREQVAIRDSIYTNVVNTTTNNVVYTIIKNLLNASNYNIFGTWDSEIDDLM